MFYSSRAAIDCVSKIEALDHYQDPAWWHVIPLESLGVRLHGAVLNAETDALGRIIVALTQRLNPAIPPIFHFELELLDNADPVIMQRAEAELGKGYDYEKVLSLSYRRVTSPTTGRWWCNEYCGWCVLPFIPGLQIFTSPGEMDYQLTGLLDLPQPKLAAPPVELADADFDWLDKLPAEKLATGTKQEVQAVLEALGA